MAVHVMLVGATLLRVRLPDVDLPRGVAGYALGTALAGVAALLFAVGSVAQHEVTSGSVSGGGFRWRTVLRHRWWLLGQAATVLGALVQVAALGLAPVAIVQPLLAGGLVLALGIRAVRDRRWPGPKQWLGALLTTGGLAVFLVAARPGPGSGDRPASSVVAVVAATVVVLCLLTACLGRGRVGALTGGLTAGVGLGVAAVLISAALNVLQHRGLLAAVTGAALWAAIATAVAGGYSSQVAFTRGTLSLSLPALTVIDPVAAVVAARVLLGERLSLHHAVVWGPAGALAALGVAVLALAGERHPAGHDGPTHGEPATAGD